MTSKIRNFKLHGDRGISVLDKDFLNWLESHKSYELGRIVAYSWNVNELNIQIDTDISQEYWKVLPDASGFICFESGSNWKSDNCVLLDIYGKERIRLSIPWQLTKSQKPEAINQESFFINISAPYVNPTDGVEGNFGVTARIAHEGKYYFELDYQTGQFLWGKAIWD